MRARYLAGPIGILVLLLTGLAFLPVAAQGPTPSDDEVNAIAKELYCPVCPNEPLDTCTTLACIQWRETIREKLSEGWDVDQIKAYFVEQYGDRVLATPPARGLNWLIYILPPVVILAGMFFLIRAMRRWSRSADTTPLPADLSDPYLERVEEELRKRS